MSQTVARAIDIISFVSRGRRSLSEISEHIGVHKSTALRTLQTLEEHGFVRRNADGRYMMGFELIALGQLALDEVESRTLAHDSLQQLASACGHTVHLGQLVAEHVVYVDKVDGRGSVAMGSRIGLTAQTHTAAVAKVIAAYQPDDVKARMVAGATYERYTNTTITTPTDLEGDLDRARERGWAEDDGEHEDYINCVALPIYDIRGRVTHGLSVTALRAVAPLEQLRAVMPQFQETADQISRKLGWKGHPNVGT